MKYTQEELAALISQVETAFTAELAKAEAGNGDVLAKSEDAAKPEEKEESKKDEAASKVDAKADESQAEAKDESAEKPAAEGKESEAPASAEKPAEEAKEEQKADSEDCDYDDEDHEHMHKMYSSMSKGELKAHHDACRKALDGKGMAKCGEMHAEAPLAKSEAEQIAAIEIKPETVEQSKELELAKSELAAKTEQFEELQKNFDLVAEVLTKLVKKSAPQGKAVTSLDVVAKSETEKEVKPLTQSEITAILTKKAADPSLKKSDREAINDFYNVKADISKINHLLN